MVNQDRDAENVITNPLKSDDCHQVQSPRIDVTTDPDLHKNKVQLS